MLNSTESTSKYDHLEEMTVGEVLRNINNEDKTVPLAIEKVLPQIEKLVSAIVPRMQSGGRLFYIGAGTSGRLGILDASECPPTYGVPDDMVVGIIAGGEKAIRSAVENAEDNKEQAWKDLSRYRINSKDSVIGIAASGRTPYVIGGLEIAQRNHVLTGCIVCNADTAIAKLAEFPVECVVGSEFVTGSTRMKSGTAQKLILNMISTSIMIQLGRVKGNKMVDMQLSNEKLVNRGIKMLMDELNIERALAEKLLNEHGNVRRAIDWYNANA